MLSMTYRKATSADYALLGALNHQLIRDEGHRNPMNVAELTERMRRWLGTGEYTARMFEEDGEGGGLRAVPGVCRRDLSAAPVCRARPAAARALAGA